MTCPSEHAFDLASQPIDVRPLLQFAGFVNKFSEVLDVNGKRISFTENVFYEFRQDRIVQVWSVIDKAAIEAQL